MKNSDDAEEYKGILHWHQLCWIHEIRHYRVNRAFTDYGKEIYLIFFKQFWEFYDRMKKYSKNPSQEEKLWIENEFKNLFETSWGFSGIDNLQKNTIGRKAGLLRFLEVPSLPIDNNMSESSAQEKGLKKKISYGHRSLKGAKNGNFWLGLYITLRKNKLDIWNFLLDRFTFEMKIPSISEVMLST